MKIGEYFRRILKHDLALDGASGRWRMLPDARALQTIVMAVVIVATRRVIGVSSLGDVVLLWLGRQEFRTSLSSMSLGL